VKVDFLLFALVTKKEPTANATVAAPMNNLERFIKKVLMVYNDAYSFKGFQLPLACQYSRGKHRRLLL